MNIGIRLHDCAPGTLRERLGFAARQGFACAHVALSKTVDGFDMADAPELLTDAFAAELRTDFSAQRMQCAVLGCYLNLADPDAESRRRTQEIYKAHLRFAPSLPRKARRPSSCSWKACARWCAMLRKRAPYWRWSP